MDAATAGFLGAIIGSIVVLITALMGWIATYYIERMRIRHDRETKQEEIDLQTRERSRSELKEAYSSVMRSISNMEDFLSEFVTTVSFMRQDNSISLEQANDLVKKFGISVEQIGASIAYLSIFCSNSVGVKASEELSKFRQGVNISGALNFKEKDPGDSLIKGAKLWREKLAAFKVEIIELARKELFP